MRFAVSLVTCRHAASFNPLSGCSFAKRARIRLKTGAAYVVIIDRFLAEATIEDECIDRCRGGVGAPK